MLDSKVPGDAVHADGNRRNSAERPKQPVPTPPPAVKQEEDVVRSENRGGGGVGIAEALEIVPAGRRSSNSSTRI